MGIDVYNDNLFQNKDHFLITVHWFEDWKQMFNLFSCQMQGLKFNVILYAS